MAGSATNRSNDAWLRALRAGAPGTALEDLRAYLKQGLAKALGSRPDVSEQDIEDFTHDAMVRVMEKLETFRGDSRLTTWAMTITIRVAYSALRRRRWEGVSLDALEAGAAETVVNRAGGSEGPDSASRADVLVLLRQAIDTALTDRQRQVVLAELQGMPTAALAERLNTNPNALYKVHHDARKRLRRTLEEAGVTLEDVRTTLGGASKV